MYPDSEKIGFLKAEAIALSVLGANTVDTNDIGAHAINYALRGWEVFPLRGKVPAIPLPHPQGSPERRTCKGECGLQGHGVLDATTDIDVIAGWWGGKYAGANIGVRPPQNVFVLDVDPQHGGHRTLDALEAEHGPLPDTLTTWTGRGDGSRHLYLRRPAGRLTDSRLPGIDIKDHSGYLVAAPSIHPETRKPYRRVDAPVAVPPAWLVKLIRPEPAPVAPRSSRRMFLIHSAGSIAEAFSASASWSEILGPHGWSCLDADPDADGARWRHPTATSPSSATVRHGCLFVYSPNTPFAVTTRSDPYGYTKFRAYAVLDHAGDLKAAARALRLSERT